MSAARSIVRTHALAYFCLAALFLLSVVHFARDAFDRLDAVRHASEYVRAPFQLGDANWGVEYVQPEAEAEGMKVGDAVLAVNGCPIDGFFVYYGALRDAKVGDRVRVRIQTPPAASNPVRDLSIELRAYGRDPGAAGRAAYIDFALRVVALPVVCVALGFWVAAVRITDRFAWLLLALLLGLAAYIGGGSGVQGLFGREGVLQPLFAGFHVFLALIAAPTLMLFGIAFPERLPLDRRFPWLKWIVVGHLLLVALLEAINVGLWVHHLAWARPFQRAVELLTGREGDFGAAVSLVALLVCVASLGWKTATSPNRDARRRLLLLDVGAVPSVAALLTFLVGIRTGVRFPLWSSFLLLTWCWRFL